MVLYNLAIKGEIAMTSLGNSTNAQGGSNPPPMTEMQIMQTLCLAQNHNMQEVSNLAQTQESFTSIQTKAGQASESKIKENLHKIKKMSNLSMILGVVTSFASGLAGASSMSGIGASSEALMSGMSSVASGLGNGVGPVTEGGLTIAQAKQTKEVGENRADSSVAGSLMKGFDEIGKDSSETIGITIQNSSQMTSKEQSIISEDRQSKMYN